MTFFDDNLFYGLVVAYIGPGAGFAFVGSILVWLIAGLLVLVSILGLPLRFAAMLLGRRKRRRRGATSRKRVVLIGLDGLDPRHATRLMQQGKLPSLTALARQGFFSELQTTQPPVSPVAWSSFMTGVNPGKHNIFDFIARDLRTYLPELSTARVRNARGSLRAAGTRPEIELLRKSKPFWQILGENGIFSTVLRVPVTFPAEPFYGLCLSGMGVPDLRGTQGTYTIFETSSRGKSHDYAGLGVRVAIHGRRITGTVPGPSRNAAAGDRANDTTIPIVIDLLPDGESARVNVSRQTFILKKGAYSDWIPLTFKTGWRKICGICRFYLVSVAPEFRLYMTPIHIDPEHPAMPVSHPLLYSIYLAKLHGPYATLGLAEDTSALNEGIIDDDAFLKQCYDIQQERESIFFDALAKTRQGFCACVFELPDRVQHMFHPPSPRRCGGASSLSPDTGQHHQGAIDGAYIHMDNLVGRAMEAIDDETTLLIMSDHGFTGFRRGVNLNAWLKNAGLLTLRPAASEGDWLRDVDWEKTKAYSMGLSGIYLNIKGREAGGIVPPNEAESLKAKIISALGGILDPATGKTAIRRAYDSRKTYWGPYGDNAPDILVGYAEGYRASWESATGRTDGEIFTDNPKHWSGDHCVDAALVPGVFFCNQPVELNGRTPHIMDMAPTILNLFGIETPAYMDGSAWPVKPASKLR